MAPTLTVATVPTVKVKKGSVAVVTLKASLPVGYHANSNNPTESYLIPLNLKWTSGPLQIDVDLIDNEFCQLLFAQLRSTHDFDDYRKHAEELKKKHQSEQKLLKRQLEQVRKEQNKIIKKVLALSSLKSESIIEGLNEQHKELKKREADLEKKLSHQKEPTVLMPFTQLEEFHTQLEKIIEVWDRKPFDYKQRFINTLVEKIVLTIPSPHWVRLEVHWTWKMPGWESKVLYIYRPRGHKATLTEAERQFLRENYLQLGRKALLQALPEKSWEAINKEALKLGLRRKSREAIDIPDTLTWKDVEFMEQEELDLEVRTTKCVSLRREKVCFSSPVEYPGTTSNQAS